MRRLSASLALVSLATLGLTGCAASTANCVASEGNASKAVKVDGDFGTKPTVTFDKGLTVQSTERTVVIQGSGDPIESGSSIKMDYTLYNATTGELIETSAYAEGQEVSYPVDAAATQFAGLSKTLVCSTVGSRVIGVIPNSEAFAEQASAAGLGADDVLLFVIDVEGLVDEPLAEATGTPVDPKDGFPEVVFTDGKPAVTIPSGAVPTEYAIETLIQGDGDVVADGATVVVNYHGVNWNTGEVFDSSFDRGTPATFSTSQVIQGFHDAIVGQKIGSRVVVIIPSDLGYGDAGSGDKIKGGDTLVFVVDILGLG
ncbi:MAG: FKBP-type peptidyl-prolyl cis-trans isomerase [Microbacteriaceae bacterium]